MHPHSANLQVIASLKNVLAIRPLWKREYALLRHFLYEAIYVAEGEASPPLSVLEDPSLSHYIQDFGRDGDYALVAEVQDKVVGAVWVRLFDSQDPGYGYFNSKTPELCISIDSAYRHKGLGRQLLEEMCEVLGNAGFEKVSLSVQKKRVGHTSFTKAWDFLSLKREGLPMSWLSFFKEKVSSYAD